jgi:hypothetical protein
MHLHHSRGENESFILAWLTQLFRQKDFWKLSLSWQKLKTHTHTHTHTHKEKTTQSGGEKCIKLRSIQIRRAWCHTAELSSITHHCISSLSGPVVFMLAI